MHFRESAFGKASATDDFGNIKLISATKLGKIAVEQKDYKEAERSFRTVITLAPGAAVHHVELAKALRAQGREAEAQEQDRLKRQISIAIRNANNSHYNIYVMSHVCVLFANVS